MLSMSTLANRLSSPYPPPAKATQSTVFTRFTPKGSVSTNKNIKKLPTKTQKKSTTSTTLSKKAVGWTQYDSLYHRPVECWSATTCSKLRDFESVSAAAKAHNCLPSDMQSAIDAGNSCKGYLWQYVDRYY